MGESAVLRRRSPTLCRLCILFCQCVIPFIVVCSLPLYKAYTQLEVPLEQKIEKKTKKVLHGYKMNPLIRHIKHDRPFWSAISPFFPVFPLECLGQNQWQTMPLSLKYLSKKHCFGWSQCQQMAHFSCFSCKRHVCTVPTSYLHLSITVCLCHISLLNIEKSVAVFLFFPKKTQVLCEKHSQTRAMNQ